MKNASSVGHYVPMMLLKMDSVSHRLLGENNDDDYRCTVERLVQGTWSWNLPRRGINNCYTIVAFVEEDIEDITHLLLHCHRK